MKFYICFLSNVIKSWCCIYTYVALRRKKVYIEAFFIIDFFLELIWKHNILVVRII